MTQNYVGSDGQVSQPGWQISRGTLKRIVLRGVFLAGAIFVMTPSPPADAQNWFKCQDGYEMIKHSRQPKMACKKYIGEKTTNLRCPSTNFMGRRIGTRLRVTAGRDKCRGMVRIAGVTSYTDVNPLGCGPQGAGTAYKYKMDHHGTADKCVMFRYDGFFLRNGWVYTNHLVQTY